MRVLVVSFRFAPFNSIGTNRINALIDFLKKNGVEYKVIVSYAGIHNNRDFMLDKNVHYVSWFDFRTLKKISTNSFEEQSKSNVSFSQKNKVIGFFLSFIKRFLITFLYPDPYIHWVYGAKKEGLKIMKEFNPDIIYSSSYPYSSHIVANYLSKKNNIRWFAELRDPWVDNHIKKNKFSLRKLDVFYSKKILKKAIMLVTVSNTWKKYFQKLYGIKTMVVRNGFFNRSSQLDFLSTSIINNMKSSKRKKIVYTGSVFHENQEIISFLKSFVSCKKMILEFDFVFVGSQSDFIKQQLRKINAPQDNFIIHDKVTHETALELQLKADFLLIFNWKSDNIISKGIIPGKFYEYLGVNKPIILWNLNVNNELVSLSENINSSNKKIIIINNSKLLYHSLFNFNYNSNTSSIDVFSRTNQFNILLSEFKKYAK